MKVNVIINHSEIVWARLIKNKISIGFKNGMEKVFEWGDEIKTEKVFQELSERLIESRVGGLN